MGDFPSPQQSEILKLIEGKVSIIPYFRRFSGSFKGESMILTVLLRRDS